MSAEHLRYPDQPGPGQQVYAPEFYVGPDLYGEGNNVVIYTPEGRLDGAVTLDPEGNKQGRVYGIDVSQTARGTGQGRALLAEFAGWAVEGGARLLRSTVTHPAALRNYVRVFGGEHVRLPHGRTLRGAIAELDAEHERAEREGIPPAARPSVVVTVDLTDPNVKSRVREKVAEQRHYGPRGSANDPIPPPFDSPREQRKSEYRRPDAVESIPIKPGVSVGEVGINLAEVSDKSNGALDVLQFQRNEISDKILQLAMQAEACDKAAQAPSYGDTGEDSEKAAGARASARVAAEQIRQQMAQYQMALDRLDQAAGQINACGMQLNEYLHRIRYSGAYGGTTPIEGPLLDALNEMRGTLNHVLQEATDVDGYAGVTPMAALSEAIENIRVAQVHIASASGQGGQGQY